MSKHFDADKKLKNNIKTEIDDRAEIFSERNKNRNQDQNNY